MERSEQSSWLIEPSKVVFDRVDTEQVASVRIVNKSYCDQKCIILRPPLERCAFSVICTSHESDGRTLHIAPGMALSLSVSFLPEVASLIGNNDIFFEFITVRSESIVNGVAGQSEEITLPMIAHNYMTPLNSVVIPRNIVFGNTEIGQWYANHFLLQLVFVICDLLSVSQNCSMLNRVHNTQRCCQSKYHPMKLAMIRISQRSNVICKSNRTAQLFRHTVQFPLRLYTNHPRSAVAYMM